jgi:hypothetical protein
MHEAMFTSSGIKEMQIKTTLTIHPIPVRLESSRQQEQMLVRMWEKGTLIHCWWEDKLVQPLWKSVWRLLIKLKIDLPYNSAILFGAHIQRSIKICKRDTCILCLL